MTTEFPPYHGGGISTYCTEMARALPEAGVRLTVFVADWSLQERRAVEESRTRVIRFNPAIAAIRSLSGRATLAYGFKEVVLEAIAEFGAPDLIESQDYCGLSYFLSMEKLCGNAALRNVPIVVMMHTPEFALRQVNSSTNYIFPEFWNDELERFSLKAADLVWAPSHAVLNELGDGALSSRAQVIRNPYGLPPAPSSGEAEGLFYFGRVQRLKGIERLMTAYSRLVEGGLAEPLNIIGGDASFEIRGITMMEHLHKTHRRLIGEDKVRFAGLLPRKEALDRLKSARVVVMPSLYENFSYAALESMSMERVIVTSRQSGHSEVMKNGWDGFVFDHDVPGDLQAKLADALSLSPTERDRIGRNARETVAEVCRPDRIIHEKLTSIRNAKVIVPGAEDKRAFPFLRLEKLVEVAEQMPPRRPTQAGLLTIVIPYFNLEAFLAEAIDSALAVDYPNTEVLILNASSTKTESIAEFYRLRELHRHVERLRFLHIDDHGLADTRNRGAELARGEFVTFLDSDDRVRPSYYSKAIDVLSRFDNVGFVGCWVQYFEGSDNQWITWNAEPPYLLFHNTMNSASAVYRRELFLACGGNDVSMFVGMEDYEMLVRMVAHGFGGVALPEILFDYRVRANSMMRQLAPRSNIYNYEQIARRNSALFEKHAVAFAGLLNANGPGYRHDNPLISAGFG